jgi:hypothetical protein
MPTIKLHNQNTQSGYRIVSSLESDSKSICQECGFITADDPDLAYIKMLSFEESQALSKAHGMRIISRHYDGCCGFD